MYINIINYKKINIFLFIIQELKERRIRNYENGIILSLKDISFEFDF